MYVSSLNIETAEQASFEGSITFTKGVAADYEKGCATLNVIKMGAHISTLIQVYHEEADGWVKMLRA